jgi:hypothetical protein
MGLPIVNANAIPLNQNTGTMPNVLSALLDWFQPMTFTTLVKAVVGFQNVEVPTNIDFRGVWQPFTAQQLNTKPDGQTAWRWFTVHADTTLILKPDEVITYLGSQYRVKEKLDYSLNGYVEYHIIEDFTGSGP